MKYYFSVDGGGTKTAFLLCDEDGNKITEFNLGPTNYLVNGMEDVINIYKEGISKFNDYVLLSEIDCGFIALAGYKDIKKDIEPIYQLVKSNIKLDFILGNDTENALAGALLGKEGINIISGTGSIGLGYDKSKNFIRSGGWHHIFLGDEGSGYWLGCELLREFTKQADGRSKKTLLYDYIMTKYGFSDDDEILNLVINTYKLKREKIASFAIDVSNLAKMNDINALRIFNDAARELAQIANSIYRRGDFSNTIDLSFTGSVFKSYDFFKDSFINSLNFNARVVKPRLSPLYGGILLAFNMANININNKILDNLLK